MPHPEHRDRRAGSPGAHTPGASSPLGVLRSQIPKSKVKSHPPLHAPFPSVLIQTTPPPRGGARCGRDLPLTPSLSCSPGRSLRTPEIGVRLGRRHRVLEGPTLRYRKQGEKKTKKQKASQPLCDLEKETLISSSQINRIIVFTQLAGASLRLMAVNCS